MEEKLGGIFTYDKEKYENFLDDDGNALGVLLNKYMSFLVILFIFILVLESVDDFNILFSPPSHIPFPISSLYNCINV